MISLPQSLPRVLGQIQSAMEDQFRIDNKVPDRWYIPFPILQIPNQEKHFMEVVQSNRGTFPYSVDRLYICLPDLKDEFNASRFLVFDANSGFVNVLKEDGVESFPKYESAVAYGCELGRRISLKLGKANAQMEAQARALEPRELVAMLERSCIERGMLTEAIGRKISSVKRELNKRKA